MLRAISLWQPHATLWLLNGEKTFETRPKHTHIRGRVLVHAAQKRDGEVRAALSDPDFIEGLERHGLYVSDLAFGAIIGEVDIIGSCQMSRMPEPSDRERSFGNWKPNRFAWERASKPTLYKNPIPWKGKQGWMHIPESVVPFGR